MKPESTITFKYASDFEKNEEKWRKIKEDLKLLCIAFSKDTSSQLLLHSDYMDILDLVSAIHEGDRSSYMESRIRNYQEKFSQDISKSRVHYKDQVEFLPTEEDFKTAKDLDDKIIEFKRK